MDRYRNIPPQVTETFTENRLRCVDYARIVGNHDRTRLRSSRKSEVWCGPTATSETLGMKRSSSS